MRLYETELARRIGVRHVVAFACARHALTKILAGSGLGPGDQVVLSPLTCKVVPLALLSMKLDPVYADVGNGTLNLDADTVPAALGPRTRAVLFQHTYGHSVGIEGVAEVAARAGVALIEDCAQCLPMSAALPGLHGVAAIFSNNLLKPLPAGSGGVAATPDDDLAGRLRQARAALTSPGFSTALRQRAESWMHSVLLRPRSYWPLLALQQRLDSGYRSLPLDEEIAAGITATDRQISPRQARLGLAWLERLDGVAAHRKRCCEDYARALGGREDVLLPAEGTDQPLYYFPVLVADKFEVLRRARGRLVELVAWPTRTPIYPVERMEDLARYGYRTGSCPEAERVAGHLIGLPTHPRVSAKTRQKVVSLFSDGAQP